MPTLILASNQSGTHLAQLQAMFSSGYPKILIASPYLAGEITDLLDQFDFSCATRLDLVTTMKPGDPEQLTKPATLLVLAEYFERHLPKTTLRIHIDNDLHGKVYLASGDKGAEMLVSSANFTHRGLKENHEWGLKTTDRDAITAASEEIFDGIEYPEVTKEQLRKATLFADQYRLDRPDWTSVPNITCDILSVVYSDSDLANTNPQYFLKPIGDSGNPVTDEWTFVKLHEPLHFAKRPAGVRRGDIIITTAVGPTCLLSWYKVTGGLERVSEEDILQHPWQKRWQWYVEGRNQSLEFGRSWMHHNLRRKAVLEEFLATYPGQPVTDNGHFSLGALNHGGDKVKLTPEFGEFLIAKIRQAERTTTANLAREEK